MLSIAKYDLFEIFYDTGRVPISEYSFDGNLLKLYFQGSERLSKLYLKDSSEIINSFHGQYEAMILYDSKGSCWTILPTEKSLVLIGPVQTGKNKFFPYQSIPEYSWESFLAISNSFARILLGKKISLKVLKAVSKKDEKGKNIYDQISGFNFGFKSFENIFDCIKAGDLSSLQTILHSDELQDYLDMVIKDKESAKRVFEFALTKAYHSVQSICGATEELSILTNIYLNAENKYKFIAAYRSGLFNMFYDFTKFVNQFNNQKYSRLVNKIMIYINEHLYEQIKVSDLADYCMFSVSKLQHQFKQETGFTITQMICKKKIEKSCFFLQYTNLSCNDIAVKMGFCSQSHYINSFKKIKNVTPTQYRFEIPISDEEESTK